MGGNQFVGNGAEHVVAKIVGKAGDALARLFGLDE